MAEPWTLAEAQEHLAAWLAAELACSKGQEYRVGNQSVRRADLPQISAQIAFWRNEVARLQTAQPTGMRVRQIVARDM